MYTNSKLMPRETLVTFEKHFNIIDVCEFKDFDNDWNWLRSFFKSKKKQYFEYLDKFIIIHQDTDVYIKNCNVGINLRNFFEILNETGTPYHTVIFWTNHFGIQKEIDSLCNNKHTADRPLVIESFCTTTHVAQSYSSANICEDSISMHALTMMSQNRSHRYALMNFLEKTDRNKIAISFK